VTAQVNENIPVVDVDQAFPAMVDASRPAAAYALGDVTGTVDAALRATLGWRPRRGDPKAFLDALGSSFRLRQVEGHTVADFVPRGYAVQSDLGAVTGGQASLYRRAQIARTEMLRILDGLGSLRMDSDAQDMDAYRLLVRNAIQRLVDEIGAAGGPRVQMVDQYFRSLTGQHPPTARPAADTIGGQLGGLRDRFGLVDANVNTIEEEGVRTSFWTLVDLVADLQSSWAAQSVAFTGGAGQGFLGTDLILISRLMEAAADQVHEVEAVLDSVLIPVSERRTIMLDPRTSLTLDGLLTWLHGFLSEEGRRIAQDSGRDGIVSFVAPTAVELLRTFRQTLADRLGGTPGVVQFLPASCCAPLPAGMLAARTRIAVASLCRLLTDLAQTAQRVGRFPRAVLLNITVRTVATRDNTVEVTFRGINLRPSHIPAFVLDDLSGLAEACPVPDHGTDHLLLGLAGSSTSDDESITAFFEKDAVHELMGRILTDFDLEAGFTVPAEDVATAIIDGETGLVVYAPDPRTYPDIQRLDNPLRRTDQLPAWDHVAANEAFRSQPVASYGGPRAGLDPDPLPYDRPCDCDCDADGPDPGSDGDPYDPDGQDEKDVLDDGVDDPAEEVSERVARARAFNELLEDRDETASDARIRLRGRKPCCDDCGQDGSRTGQLPCGCGKGHGDCQDRDRRDGCDDRDDQDDRPGPQVTILIGQILALTRVHIDELHELSAARLEYGRRDGMFESVEERYQKVSGAARSNLETQLGATRDARAHAEADVMRREQRVEELGQQLEELHAQLAALVAPPATETTTTDTQDGE